MPDRSPFMDAFPKADEAQWRAAVEKVLKGAEFEKKLVGKTADGIAIQPLYPKAEGRMTAGENAGRRWRIVAPVDHPVSEEATKLALADLEGGATSLNLAFAGSIGARGYGIAPDDAAGLDALLAGIRIDLIALRVESAPFAGRRAAALLAGLAARRKITPEAVWVDLGLDPIGDMARAGSSPLPFADLAADMARMARDMRGAGFKGHMVRADGRPYHEAGASEGQELAAILATLVAYLRALEAGGLPLDEARACLSATLTVDADQFLSIAKLRALRRLWTRVEGACGLAPKPLSIHAETAWRMMTRRDPFVNMLRATIAAFAAGVGGADSLAVLPFTAALGLPDGFARRVARNTQSVLQDEANLWRVADPAAGSGGLEALTEALCEKGWSLFQDLEREGGMAAALANGHLARGLARQAEALRQSVATRKTPLTGTSEFPDIAEPPVAVLDVARIAGTMPGPGALPSIRLAEPFEALRDRAEKTAPAIFLATLGAPAAFTPRAGFAANLFEAGGIRALASGGFAQGNGTDLVALTEAFKAAGTRLACICGTDDAYALEAADAAMALAASGATCIYLAGRPGALEPALRAAGVAGFVHAGCDVVAVLTSTLDSIASI